MQTPPRTPFYKLPASDGERGICISNFPSTSKASAIKPLGLFAFGSLNGNVNLSAGNHYQQTGSNVTAGHADATGQFVSAGDVNITAKDVDISGQATIGAGASVSGSFSNSNTHANYASVNEQSGILAGDGGYHVNVKNHTDLKGGIITSTQAAEDAGNNYFGTGTLTASNIQNHADYDASGFGVSGGFGVNGKGEQGNWAPQGANTNGVVAANQQGKAGTTVNKSVGYASDSDSNASTTVSGINTANLTITNTAGQAQLLGKPADTPDASVASAVKQSIATSTTTTEVQANSGAIANNFDKDAVQSEIDLQVKVTQQFDTTRQQATSMVNTKIDSLKKELEAAKTPEEAKAIQDKIDNWQLAGLGINSIAAGLSAPTSSGLGIAVSAATPTLQFEIGQYFKDNKVKNEQEKELAGLLGLDTNNVNNRAEEGSPAHLLAQTLLAAASAYAGGNNGLMAGLATGAGEAFTPTLSNWLYGKPPQELSADQKQTLSNIVGLGAVGFTASMGGSGADIANSASLAQIGVEENRNRSGLSKKEGDLQASDYCRTHPNGAGCKPNQVSQAYQTTVKGMMNLCAKDHSVCSTQIEVAKGMLDKTTNSAARGQILNYIQVMQGIWDGSPTAQAEYAMKEQQRIDDLNKRNAQVLIDTGFNKQNYSVVYPDGNPSAIHVGIDGKPLIADSFVAGGCSAYAQNCGSAIERALYDDPRSQAVVTDWTLAQHETGLGELSNGLDWMQIAAPVTKPVAGTIQVAVDGVKYEVMYERNKEWVTEIVKDGGEKVTREAVVKVLTSKGMPEKVAEATAKVLVEKASSELLGE